MEQAEEFNQILEEHEKRLDELCQIEKKVEKDVLNMGDSDSDEIEVTTTFINQTL